jgi:hypothetical protein
LILEKTSEESYTSKIDHLVNEDMKLIEQKGNLNEKRK